MDRPASNLNSESKSPLRIIALGDCNSNTNDPKQGTVPAATSESLVEAGFQIELTNHARGMETSREGLSRLLECDAVADVAIINYGLVDAWETSIPAFYVPYYPDSFVRKRRRKAVKFAKRMLMRLPNWVWIPRGSVVPEREFQSNIERMMQLIRQKNPKVVIYLWGTALVGDAPERNKNLLRYNNLLQNIADRTQAVFIDTSNALNELPEADRHLDRVHLSPAAAQLIGNRICQQYVSQPNRSLHAA